jgi:serine phosphatase RsbU (regulator of sigma subunit)/PAS domain-containing protein
MGHAVGVEVTLVPSTGPRMAVALLDTVLERVPVGVLVVDADLRVVRANAALCVLAGGDEDALVGRRLADVAPWIPENDARRVLESGTTEEIELADAGRPGRFVVDLQPLPGDGGPALACLVRDVGELGAWRRGMGGIERLAADLSSAVTQAEVTRLVVSRSRELVGAKTVSAALLSADGTALEMAGMAGFDEATEREWQRFDLGRRTPLGDVVRTGQPVFLDSADERARRYPDLPGPTVGEAIAALPIQGRGAVIGAIAFRFGAGKRLEPADRSALTTIGWHYGQALDRARLFEAAESERQRLQALMQQLPVGVAIAEAPSGHIVAVNDKATQIWRVPPPGPEPITDVTPYVAYHPDGSRFEPGDWPIARSLATGEVVDSEEIEVELGDGTRGWINISARPVLDAAGHVLGAVTTLVDVTEPRRRETEARFIADATDLLVESLDPDESLRRLARLVVPRLADWCVVYVLEGGRLRTVSIEHTNPDLVELAQELERRYPADLDGSVGRVITTGESQLTARITREMVEAAAPDPDFTRIIYDELGLRSALTVPLRARGRVLGALTLVAAESERLFTARDVSFAEDIATHAALAVANARLYTEQQEIALTLQRSLLPRRMPRPPGVQVAAVYRAAGAQNMVGGDFYDLWEMTGGPEGEFGFVIGDVCGKGAGAAALTALARHTVRTASIWLPGHRPDGVLRAVNDAVIKRAGSGQFCTVAYAYAKPFEDGFELLVASGGHPLPFVLRADGSVEQPGTPGTLLGILADINVHEQRIVLRPGDGIVLWTDGVSDRRGDGELFGEERLRALLEAAGAGSPREIADGIERAVVGFSATEPQDDIALLVVRIVPR